MFSYYEEGFTQSEATREIEILELVEMMIDGNHKDKINRLRKMEYKSLEYKQLKEGLSCITPAGIFGEKRTPELLKKPSGFILMDIDDLATKEEREDYKSRLLEAYGEIIYLLGTSCGGRGLFFYIKVNGLDARNYNAAFDHFSSTFFHDFNIDRNAKGVNRPHIITYDPDLFCNWRAKALELPDIELLKKATIRVKKKNETSFTLKVAFLDINEIKDRIALKTPVKVSTPVVEINPVEFFEIKYSSEIQDGRKHDTFMWLTRALMYLNPGIDLLTVQSYVSYVNRGCTGQKPMPSDRVATTVEWQYRTIQESGVNPIQPWIKRVHFRDGCNSPIEKSTMAAILNGLIRRLQTVAKINNSFTKLTESGMKVTRKAVAKDAGLCERTVQRHWGTQVDEVAAELEEQLKLFNGGVLDYQMADETAIEYKCSGWPNEVKNEDQIVDEAHAA